MIRFANINDLDGIVIVEDEAFVDGHYKREDLVYELTKNPFAKTLVSIDNNIINGFLIYIITFNSASIVQIAVKKEFQNKGVGSELINAMIDDFNKLGYGEIENVNLEVRKQNEKAHKFYIKNKFKDVTVKTKYYDNGDDAIYMMRVLL